MNDAARLAQVLRDIAALNELREERMGALMALRSDLSKPEPSEIDDPQWAALYRAGLLLRDQAAELQELVDARAAVLASVAARRTA